MSEGMQVIEQDDDVLVVSVDEAHCADIWKTIGPKVEGGKNRVVLDFSQVSYLNSMSIAAVISLRNKLIGMGGGIELSNLQASIQSVFRILKLEKLFSLDQDQESALASVRA